MECPKCHYVRQPKDSIVPDWQCPKCGVVYSKVQNALNKFVKVRLASGSEVQFNKVKLFDLPLIKKIEALRSKAANNLSGFSTGIGFFGSLESVAVASVVTGMIESSISGEMAKHGMNQLSEVGALSNQLRETAAYVPVSSIENIKYPDFGMWKAVVSNNMKRREMAHIPSNYVFVEIEGRETALFWDKIEQYQFFS
jgi:hypothetical protein